MPVGEHGQFLIGSGIDKFSGWDGELTALEISWRSTGGELPQPGPPFPDFWDVPDEGERVLAFGMFAGEVDSVPRYRLEVPPRYVVLHRPFLAPWWTDFRTSRDFLADVVLNLLGFMPLGLCAGLALNGSRLPSGLRFLLVIGAGFAVSLGVEAVQVWLPDRTSQLADLLLNTAGTGIGAAVSMPVARWRSGHPSDGT
jgi:hypothetical protein